MFADSDNSASCGFSIEVSEVQVGPAGTCQVTATPTSLRDRGLMVTVNSNDSCQDVRVHVKIRVPAAPRSSSEGAVSNNASTQLTAVEAKVLGNDRIGLDLFYNRVRATWEHTLTEVLSHYYVPSTWVTTLTGWQVESTSDYQEHVSSSLYRATQEAWFHIHIPVVADTRAYTFVQISSKPGGAFDCDFSPSYWINPHLGTYFEFSCQQV